MGPFTAFCNHQSIFVSACMLTLLEKRHVPDVSRECYDMGSSGRQICAWRDFQLELPCASIETTATAIDLSSGAVNYATARTSLKTIEK